MGEETKAAEAHLLATMARERAKHAAERRFRSYVMPIVLSAGALLGSIAIGHQPGGVLIMPTSVLITGAVLSRTYGGVIGARVAAASALPITVYIAIDAGAIWHLGGAVAIIGLCFDASTFLPTPKAPWRRSAPARAGGRPGQGMSRLSHCLKALAGQKVL